MARSTHIARYGKAWLPGEPWVRWTFLLLLALAALLRFFRWTDLAYTHDELSALVRLYPTLWETIQRGVIELDTHPPGVQVFEWAWTRLFGMNAALVKLPFIVLSLAAFIPLYRFALAWTSPPTALVTLSFMATLQYTVMYGQLARPYAVGFFTTALLADQLTRYLAFGARRNLVLSGVAIVLSAYTHHFALLLAGIMAVSGLLVVRSEQRKAYVLMCGAAFLAYVPNIPIFLKQLTLGGLSEWLHPPDRYWLADYLGWLLHFSAPLAVVTAVVVLYALGLRVTHGGLSGRTRWLLLTWGLLPLIVGIGYSIWRAPVIQYSMLLFSFPYILLAVFSGLQWTSRSVTLIMCSAIVVVAVHSLVYQREHYTFASASRYERMVQVGAQQLAEHGREKVLVLFDAPDAQVRFHMALEQLNTADLPYVQLRSDGMDPGRTDSILRANHGRLVVLGVSNGAQPELVAQVQAHFPYIHLREDLPEGAVLILGEQPATFTTEDRSELAAATPLARNGGLWTIAEDLPVKLDTLDTRPYWDFTGREFGVALELELDQHVILNDDPFEAVVELESPAVGTNMAVIMEILLGDSTLFYRGGDLRHHGASGATTLVVAGARSLAPRGATGVRLHTYIYNPDGAAIKVYGLRLFRRDANPVQNAAFMPIGRLGRRAE